MSTKDGSDDEDDDDDYVNPLTDPEMAVSGFLNWNLNINELSLHYF